MANEIRPTYQFSDSEKRLAKTLTVAYGSTMRAREHLAYIWGGKADEAGGEEAWLTPSRVPSETTLKAWRNDLDIVVDESLLEDYRAELRQQALSSAGRIASAAETLVLAKLESGEAKDAKDAAWVWGVAADKMNGRFANGTPGGSDGGVTIVTYAPAQINTGQQAQPRRRREKAIDVDVVRPSDAGKPAPMEV